MKKRITTFIVQACPGAGGDGPTSINLRLFLGDYEKLEEKKKQSVFHYLLIFQTLMLGSSLISRMIIN